MTHPTPILLLLIVTCTACHSAEDAVQSTDTRALERLNGTRAPWLALRFRGQNHGQAGLLVPPRQDAAIDIDWALTYGIFCRSKLNLAHQIARIRKENIQFVGASHTCTQRQSIFQDYELDIDELLSGSTGVAEGQAGVRSYLNMGSPVVLKFKGQDRSRAGIAFDGQY